MKWLDGDNEITRVWGEGNFLALQFDDWDETADHVYVGLDPSYGSGLVDVINDPDKNGVWKITDKDAQRFIVKVTKGTDQRVKSYNLSGLTLQSDEV